MDIKYIDRKTGDVKIENPPAEGLLRFLYDNPIGKIGILPLARRRLVSAWYGNRMDKPSSANKIQDFVDAMGIDMSEAEKNISDFTSFNDFFYRKLKPESRPIQTGLISPGDGKLLAFNHVADLDHFFVKGRDFNLPTFLADKQLAEKHKNASLIILRLAPNDYHRFHFPYSGIPSDVSRIKGKYYSVSPIAVAGNFAKIFTENKREYCTLQTEDKGDILIAPVGATMVGGIVETFVPGSPVRKGDEMGYFKFGGSTIVMLIDRDKIVLDSDLLVNTQKKIETGVKMGERIGQ